MTRPPASTCSAWVACVAIEPLSLLKNNDLLRCGRHDFCPSRQAYDRALDEVHRLCSGISGMNAKSIVECASNGTGRTLARGAYTRTRAWYHRFGYESVLIDGEPVVGANAGAEATQTRFAWRDQYPWRDTPDNTRYGRTVLEAVCTAHVNKAPGQPLPRGCQPCPNGPDDCPDPDLHEQFVYPLHHAGNKAIVAALGTTTAALLVIVLLLGSVALGRRCMSVSRTSPLAHSSEGHEPRLDSLEETEGPTIVKSCE